MGSLIQRDSQIWYGVYCFRKKRVWISTGTKDRAKAEMVFQQLGHRFLEKKAETISTFAADFLERSGSTLAAKTLELYEHSFINFKRLAGDEKMDRVTPRDAELFRSRRALEVGPVTVNIELKTLCAAFNDAKRMKIIRENPK